MHAGTGAELKDIALQDLTDCFSRDKKVTVSQEEISAYREFMKKAAAQDRNEKSAARDYLGQLYKTGDHTISVFLNRNAARNGITANYTLHISITDKPPGAGEEKPATGAVPQKVIDDCLQRGPQLPPPQDQRLQHHGFPRSLPGLAHMHHRLRPASFPSPCNRRFR